MLWWLIVSSNNSQVDLFVQQIKARETISQAKEEHRHAKAKLKESQAYLDKLRAERAVLETKRQFLEQNAVEAQQAYEEALDQEKRLLKTPLAERPLGGKTSMQRVRVLVLPKGQDPIPYLFSLSQNDLRTFLQSLRIFGLATNMERMQWWEDPPHGINLMDWTRLVGWTPEDITWDDSEESNQLATRICGCLGLRINTDCSPALHEDVVTGATKGKDGCVVS